MLYAIVMTQVSSGVLVASMASAIERASRLLQSVNKWVTPLGSVESRATECQTM